MSPTATGLARWRNTEEQCSQHYVRPSDPLSPYLFTAWSTGEQPWAQVLSRTWTHASQAAARHFMRAAAEPLHNIEIPLIKQKVWYILWMDLNNVVASDSRIIESVAWKIPRSPPRLFFLANHFHSEIWNLPLQGFPSAASGTLERLQRSLCLEWCHV